MGRNYRKSKLDPSKFPDADLPDFEFFPGFYRLFCGECGRELTPNHTDEMRCRLAGPHGLVAHDLEKVGIKGIIYKVLKQRGLPATPVVVARGWNVRPLKVEK